MDHVRGIGKFLWQQKRGDSLLRAMRDEILRGEKLPRQRLVELSQRSTISEERILWALGEGVGDNVDNFVQAVKILQKLREVK